MDGNDWSLPRINNLDALKYFTNLTKLDLSWAVINEETSFANVDISALSTLTKLELLQLACVNISDISPLSNITSLKGLVLWGGKRINDISPLASLTNLESVELKNNIITDLKPLAGLTNLKTLYLAEPLLGKYEPNYSALKDIYPNLTDKNFEMPQE